MCWKSKIKKIELKGEKHDWFWTGSQGFRPSECELDIVYCVYYLLNNVFCFVLIFYMNLFVFIFYSWIKSQKCCSSLWKYLKLIDCGNFSVIFVWRIMFLCIKVSWNNTACFDVINNDFFRSITMEMVYARVFYIS